MAIPNSIGAEVVMTSIQVVCPHCGAVANA